MRFLLALLASGVLCAQKPVTGCLDLRSLTNTQMSTEAALQPEAAKIK